MLSTLFSTKSKVFLDQATITSNLAKGLVFGVLEVAKSDVKKSEIMWLEMPFAGQVVQGLNIKGVEALLAKLDSKLSVGNLLKIKILKFND